MISDDISTYIHIFYLFPTQLLSILESTYCFAQGKKWCFWYETFRRVLVNCKFLNVRFFFISSEFGAKAVFPRIHTMSTVRSTRTRNPPWVQCLNRPKSRPSSRQNSVIFFFFTNNIFVSIFSLTENFCLQEEIRVPKYICKLVLWRRKSTLSADFKDFESEKE